MYKKIALLFALLCTSPQYASELTSWLEIKPSYFFFSASPMKHIYNNGCFEIQGSVSVPAFFCAYLDFYGSIGYRKAWGHALSTCEKTNIAIIPVDFGLKPIFNFWKRFYYSFAIGPRYFHLRQHNNSPYVDCILKGSGIGFFVNTGFNVLLADCCLLGIFGEYSYEKKAICPNMPNVYSNGSMQVGGFAFGASWGYAF
jgi:hypothetical protein